MNSQSKYVIGVDYGTDSCRAIIADVKTGEEVSAAISYYPRWKEGKYCDPLKNQYRQHPLDYIETLEAVIKEALSVLSDDIKNRITGISFDMTCCTPALTDINGTPLALLEEYKDNPNAMFILWKDHTSIKEAGEINTLAKKWHTDYTKYEGGIYSSEWVWAKVLHVLRNDSRLSDKAYSWVEHIDWIPALITGNTLPEKVIRSRCAAGHKAMWHESWGGLPDDEFLTTLSPLLKGFRDHLYTETFTSDTLVGYLTEEWANRLGLTTNVAVGVAAIDCHVGAVGAEIKTGSFVKVIGTSTCDIMAVPYEQMDGKLIPGICGQVDGSVIPRAIGLEAGQSAFGDLYAWYKDLLAWPIKKLITKSDLLSDDIKEKLISELQSQILSELTVEAEKISIEDSSVIATDWLNGRRTPDANQSLKGTLTGLTLGTSAPMIFRALVEATAFGSKAIIERFIENEIEIKEVIAIGGISQKSPFVMQILADVLNMPIKVAKSEQTCALGAAMNAAVVAGEYSNVLDAQKAMGKGYVREYYPNRENHDKYSDLYNRYKKIGKKII